ncbi:uncharacterized protein N7473_000174 [Penicillium subrubescens]|uniref:Uncharacterized protein n=1 Tax=Penicillium subrubescens TaxID=1316194 RepID=A0A1Q5SNJ6_9EURO|nr:uncharacterized protein N7473_000174 [Penicillium subrubescens]KAJ5910871.1 hypothetical protein N7473_000174 [Penicillium subrubescens]OKO89574.1 hypothetical protein PENSUB_13640 [Penicillium subrubescens]
MQISTLSNRLSRWQWAGLASLFVIAFITIIQYPLATTSTDPISASKNAYSLTASGAVSKFHLLLPASGYHFRLCRAVASAIALGYPVPVLNGWMKEGDLDASKTHLAKVRTVMQYLDSLPASSDDDLVLMIDAYDVVFQIPPDVLIERYFAITKAASARLASRYGVNSSESLAADDAPRQTILFGPEKVCYPVDWSRVGCWAVPQDIGIPRGAFGPDDGQLQHNLPRWLNSGTIMGPAKDMRLMFAATLDRIVKHYDPNHEYSDSDQMYISDVWGVQEFARSMRELRQYFHGDINPNAAFPTNEEKVVPNLEPDQRTEYHIGIDHRSELFQTRAGSDYVLEMLTFNETTDVNGTTTFATVTQNIAESPNFTPYEIYLPSNLASSITRILRLVEPAVGVVPNVTDIALETNIVTKNIYGMFHSTGGKDWIDQLWTKLWFFPYVRPLFEAMVPALQAGWPIAVADGRTWVPSHTLSANSSVIQGINATGVWKDIDDGWLSWQELCGAFHAEVFDGYTPPMDD